MKIRKSIPLISLCWNLTAKCNYNCDFCFRINNKRELYFNEAEKILRLLAEAGVKKISFSGGEPLLWTGLTNLIKVAKSLGIMTMLISNGSLITPAELNRFKNLLDWLTLPLDGSTEEIQQATGRPKGHFTHTIDLLKRLKNEKIKIKINTVACKTNFDDLTNIAKLIKKYKVKRWKIFQFYPVRSAALQNKKRFEISTLAFRQKEREIRSLFKKKDCLVYFGSNDLLENSYFSIAPDGTVYISKDKKDYMLGDLKKQGVKSIWRDAKWINKAKYWSRASWILKDKI